MKISKKFAYLISLVVITFLVFLFYINYDSVGRSVTEVADNPTPYGGDVTQPLCGIEATNENGTGITFGFTEEECSNMKASDPKNFIEDLYK